MNETAQKIINLILDVTCPYDADGRPCNHGPCRAKRSIIELIRVSEAQPKCP